MKRVVLLFILINFAFSVSSQNLRPEKKGVQYQKKSIKKDYSYSDLEAESDFTYLVKSANKVWFYLNEIQKGYIVYEKDKRIIAKDTLGKLLSNMNLDSNFMLFVKPDIYLTFDDRTRLYSLKNISGKTIKEPWSTIPYPPNQWDFPLLRIGINGNVRFVNFYSGEELYPEKIKSIEGITDNIIRLNIDPESRIDRDYFYIDLEKGEIVEGDIILYEFPYEHYIIFNSKTQNTYLTDSKKKKLFDFHFSNNDILHGLYLKREDYPESYVLQFTKDGPKEIFRGEGMADCGRLTTNFYKEFSGHNVGVLDADFKRLLPPVYQEVNCWQIGCTMVDSAGISYILPFGENLKKIDGLTDLNPTYNNFFIGKKKNETIFFDRKGNQLLKGTFYKIDNDIDENHLYVYNDLGNRLVVDLKGKEIISGNVDVEEFYPENGYAIIKQNDKYGLVNHLGEFILNPIYDEIRYDYGIFVYSTWGGRPSKVGIYYPKTGLLTPQNFSNVQIPAKGFIYFSETFERGREEEHLFKYNP